MEEAPIEDRARALLDRAAGPGTLEFVEGLMTAPLGKALSAEQVAGVNRLLNGMDAFGTPRVADAPAGADEAV